MNAPSLVSEKLRPFGTTIFAEMTALAVEHQAINLSQGFPDFDGPEDIKEAAAQAMRDGHNQYARPFGYPELVRAISEKHSRLYGLDYDPMKEVMVFSGCTEGIASSLMGLLNPGDEVIVFEPYYDSYPACLAMAGAVPRFCTLTFPDFSIDEETLRPLFTDKTRFLILNTPHNPTGRVFNSQELEIIARLCQEHDVYVIADEVYEHITFDKHEHIPIASLPGMRERTLTLSSAGKTYSMTGWKIGWGCGPESMIRAAGSAHQFVTFASATPFQVAMAHAIRTHGVEYFAWLKSFYTERRDLMVDILSQAGFEVSIPQGAYFVLADFRKLWEGDDVSFAKHLTQKCRVASIPPSVFYKSEPDAGRKMLRFAFCKSLDTLRQAGDCLRSLSLA